MMDGGTLTARRLDRWDENVHGAVYRNEWAPKQEGKAGHWWVVSPVLDVARLGPEFTVSEHDDGTISVYPSLVFERPGQSGFHGYLNRSVWSWCAFEDRRYTASPAPAEPPERQT
jgi:hypothetical protein